MSCLTVEPIRKKAVRAVTPAAGSVLQRKCACGQQSAEGECEECKKKQVALQRYSAGKTQSATVPPVVRDVLGSTGQPLDARTRSSMERSLGHDFSNVRVHRDARANESARAVNASASAAGRVVVFGSGQYARDPPRDHLIAHELALFLQQRSASRHPPRLTAKQTPPRNAKPTASGTRSPREAQEQTDLRAAASVRVATVQRQAAEPSSQSDTGYFTDAPIADTSQCIQPFGGKSLDSVLKSDTVTVVEFSATWCGPCKTLARILGQECAKRKNDKRPMQFYSVDIDENKELAAKYAQGTSVPQLYVFVGRAEKYHGTSQLSADFYSKLFDGLMADKSSEAPGETGKKGLPGWATTGLFALGGVAVAGGALAIAGLAHANVSAGAAAGIWGGCGRNCFLLILWAFQSEPLRSGQSRPMRSFASNSRSICPKPRKGSAHCMMPKFTW